tara:strand:- start:504 stop:719 length:216 start_codon:yes stop_codon:yes gene_type:complete
MCRQIRKTTLVVALYAPRNLAASWAGGGSAGRTRMDQHPVVDQFDLQPSGQERTSIHFRCHGQPTVKTAEM